MLIKLSLAMAFYLLTICYANGIWVLKDDYPINKGTPLPGVITQIQHYFASSRAKELLATITKEANVYIELNADSLLAARYRISNSNFFEALRDHNNMVDVWVIELVMPEDLCYSKIYGCISKQYNRNIYNATIRDFLCPQLVSILRQIINDKPLTKKQLQ